VISIIHQLQEVNITATDFWTVELVRCPVDAASAIGTLDLEYKLTFRNPYGYLPGKAYPLMPVCSRLSSAFSYFPAYLLFFFFQFSGWMALFYVLLGIPFLILSALHWRELLQVQYGVAGIIFLGMLESMTWYFVYASFNSVGTLSTSCKCFDVLRAASYRPSFMQARLGYFSESPLVLLRRALLVPFSCLSPWASASPSPPLERPSTRS
jgi:hypothetical protein